MPVILATVLSLTTPDLSELIPARARLPRSLTHYAPPPPELTRFVLAHAARSKSAKPTQPARSIPRQRARAGRPACDLPPMAPSVAPGSEIVA